MVFEPVVLELLVGKSVRRGHQEHQTNAVSFYRGLSYVGSHGEVGDASGSLSLLFKYPMRPTTITDITESRLSEYSESHPKLAIRVEAEFSILWSGSCLQRGN